MYMVRFCVITTWILVVSVHYWTAAIS